MGDVESLACAQDDHDPVWQAGREAGYRDALIALAEHRGEFFDELDRNIADSLRRDTEYVKAHDATVVAARTADLTARLAAVEALAERWKANAGADRDVESRTLRSVVAYLGAALHPDPSEAACYCTGGSVHPQCPTHAKAWLDKMRAAPSPAQGAGAEEESTDD